MSSVLNKEIAKNVASHLLKIGAVKLSIEKPFTWVSGIKSPVYCDNRKINSYVKSRATVADSFTRIISEYFPEVDSIAGVATGGIPMGIMIAERMELPFIYVRQEAKKYGLMKQVEGDYEEGDRTVLIEDLVSTGGSSMKAVNGIEGAGIKVEALISIMTYNFSASQDRFSSHGLTYHTLTDLDTVLEVASAEGALTNAQVAEVQRFSADPKQWKH